MTDVSNEYLDKCRNALTQEQNKSLAETDGWAHVDKQKVHSDWDQLYTALSVKLNEALPSAPEIQEIMAEHYSIACRFYVPSREAYIGMSLY